LSAPPLKATFLKSKKHCEIRNRCDVTQKIPPTVGRTMWGMNI
jgi:hypothetical protein